MFELEYLLPSNVQRCAVATVLKRMSGYFNPGEMTAVMGPSGCCKSMLMDVLAGRRTTGTVEGKILYDGLKPTAELLHWSTGYVEQFTSLIENLSVFEMLLYTAELKRSSREPYSAKKAAVEDLIKKLALTPCKDGVIGNPHLDKGISGGECKRVNIGIGLITNPGILFMDEPVSGLDSYTANEVMEVIRSLVLDGVTLCATLHSPTPYTFFLFDRILLLLQGNMVFFGNRDEVVGYFEGLAVGSFHPSQSVAEWLTEIIVRADQEDTTPVLVKGYEESRLKSRTEHIVQEFSVPQSPEASDTKHGTGGKKPFWFSLWILLRFRAWRNLTSLSFWFNRSLDKAVIVIILCTLYQGLGDDFSFSNYTNLSALMFIWSLFAATGGIVYVPRLVVERWVFYREQKDGLYPVLSYFLTKALEEFTVAAVLSVAFCSILWLVIDLQGSLLRMILIFFATFGSSILLAFFFGALAPNLELGNALFPCYVLSLLFYAGYLLLPQDIPSYLDWYARIDFLKYSYGALMVNQFQSDDRKLFPSAPSAGAADQSEIYLDMIGLGDVDRDWYMTAAYIFVVAFGALAYCAMVFVRYERKA